MTTPDATSGRPRRRIRWWPCFLILLAGGIAIAWVRAQADWPFQRRNLKSYEYAGITLVLLLGWWLFYSRAAWRLRLGVLLGLVCVGLVGAGLFRLRGVTGDLVPILEFRWTQHSVPAAAPAATSSATAPTIASPDTSTRADWPQFYGPNRDGVMAGPELETNWTTHPPSLVWRENVGPAWSGFAIVDGLCLTQEQRGEDECVVARELATGREVWRHSDPARYQTPIAGEGPRATPTIVGGRVFTYGATGILNCLDLASGRRLWTRNVVTEYGGRVPGWGTSSSPLVTDNLVIVHAGEKSGHSLLAFEAETGAPAWQGAGAPGYASPMLATLAGEPQVLAFNERAVAGYGVADGRTVWERPWGNGNVVCATPVVLGTNRVLFSSGYGAGAELIEIVRGTSGTLAAERVWKSIRMKSKFAHLYARDGFLYGLDDGILACVDLTDGSLRWKEGRYAHGQGIAVGDLYLLMAESGELVLLRPRPDAPNELGRFRVFDSKTWNPIALAGDRLLVRNDREAACLRLAVRP